MKPSAVCTHGRPVDRAYWHVESFAAVSAEAGPLKNRIEQQPQGDALADRRPLLLPRVPFALVKCTFVKRVPIVPRPMCRTFAIAGSPSGRTRSLMGPMPEPG